MGYHLERDEAIDAGFKRIALEQIDKAIDDLQASDTATEDRIHQLRKRCKKLRGLLRLVRPGLGDVYERENALFRDLAGRFSHLRDHHVLIETFDALMERHDDEVRVADFQPLRHRLKLEAKRLATEQVKFHDAVDETVEALRQARDRVVTWPIEDDLDGVLAGLKKTYKRGRKALEEARDDATPEAMHELRKRAKYTWYHYRLLQQVWPKIMKAYRKEADRLGDTLGDGHDLAVFEDHLTRFSDGALSAEAAEALQGLARARRSALDARSLAHARLFYSEKPGKLTKRLAGYYRTWRKLQEAVTK